MNKLVIALCAAAAIFAGCAKKTVPSYLWVDAQAGFSRLANSRDSIEADCRRIAEMGFTDIIVDVRPTCGDVLFKSRVAPALKQMPSLRNGRLRLAARTADFDYLQAFIEEGHKAGLRVNAGVNVMVGGWKAGDFEMGMVYEHPELKNWCSVDNTPDGLLNEYDDTLAIGGRFLDPANPDVQSFLLTMLEDIAAYDGLDGIILDRCRYDDYALDAGYTECARRGFAEYIGREPEVWPVFPERGKIFLEEDPTPLQAQWLTYRCRVIHDFVAKAAGAVHSVAPKVRFGVYVGAWFSEYYRSGVNWTSSSYALAANEPTYSWAGPDYQAAGFADLLDFIMLGAYAAADDVHGDEEWTMEGFARLGRKRLCGIIPFAAGPDIGNGKGFGDGGRQDVIPDIVRTMKASADGLFIFDFCHIRIHDYWQAFKEANNQR